MQPTLVTREKQLEDWGRLVIDYAEHNKIYSIDLADAALSPLFHNAKLNRELEFSQFDPNFTNKDIWEMSCLCTPHRKLN